MIMYDCDDDALGLWLGCAACMSVFVGASNCGRGEIA